MTETKTGNLFLRPDVRKWLAVGLLVRLVVMPLTTHSDLLSIYHRAHLILAGKTVEGLGPNLLNILHAGFLWVMSPLISDQTVWANPQVTSLAVSDWLGFVNSSSIFRTLFLFKMPYLIFEVLAVWVLFRLIEPEHAGRVAAFWMLNPVIIFSTYIFGRFDIIIVWLLLTALFFARSARPNLAVLLIGFAALVRIYPIILVLPFAFILSQDWRGRLRLISIGALPSFAALVLSGSAGQMDAIKDLGGMAHMEYPLSMKFFLYNQDTLYVFVFLYSLIVMYLYLHPRAGFENLTRFSLYVMLTFFATSFFHPHYLMWLIPFTVFFIDIPRFTPIFAVQVSAWVIYMFQWGRSMAGYLVAPLSPAFFWSLNSPGEWLGRFYPSDQFVGLGRSLFSAAAFTLAYVVWRQAALISRPGVFANSDVSTEPLVDEGGA